jgi:hypothetical protein
MDVNAIDLTGIAADDVADLQRAAADNVKRTYRPADGGDGAGGDWRRDPGLRRLKAVVEIKTVWHPVGA